MKISVNGINIWVNYHHLYYFFVVVNEGSLANASKILLIGQPSLSSQIRQFEQTVGVELFDRTHKRLTLTSAGKTAHTYAMKIFQLGHEMVESLQPKMLGHEIRIGIPDNVSNISMLELCKKVLNDSTNILNITRGKSSDLLKELNNRSIDFLIMNTAPTTVEAPGILCRKIHSSPIVFCADPVFKNLIEDFPASLQSAPFMLPLPGCPLRNELDIYFKKNKIKIKLVGETKDVSIQKLITQEGLSIMAAPLSSVQASLDRNELIEIGRPTNMSEDLFLLASNSNGTVNNFKAIFQETLSH